MVTFTPNLNLSKPAGTDFVDIAVLNGNMDTLDGMKYTAATRPWGMMTKTNTQDIESYSLGDQINFNVKIGDSPIGLVNLTNDWFNISIPGLYAFHFSVQGHVLGPDTNVDMTFGITKNSAGLANNAFVVGNSYRSPANNSYPFGAIGYEMSLNC